MTINNLISSICIVAVCSPIAGCSQDAWSEASLHELNISVSNAWKLSERSVPPPSAASKEQNQFIGSISAPNPDTRKTSIPSTDMEWMKLIELRESNALKFNLSELERDFNVRVKTTSVTNVTVYEVFPNDYEKYLEDAALLYLHGGAYVFNGGIRGVYEAILISSYTGLRVFSVDYRMPPSHPYPAGLNDALAVYIAIADRNPKLKLALGGTSAGASLAVALTQEIKNRQLPRPWAVYAGSPWVDLTKTGDTLFTLEGLDHVLVTYDGVLAAAAKLYAAGLPLGSPLISPIYGEFDEFPPVYLVTGTRDLLLSDTIRLHRKLKVAGVKVELNVYEGLSHAEYLRNPASIESQQVYLELAQFLHTALKEHNIEVKYAK